jgi:quinol monooxygenase YgiN
MSVVAVADMYGIAGRRQEMLSTLAESERHAAGQVDCLRYVFAETIAEPDHFVLISEWRNQAALERHYGSEDFAGFQRALNGLLARPSEMTIHTVSGSSRPQPSGAMDPRDAD